MPAVFDADCAEAVGCCEHAVFVARTSRRATEGVLMRMTGVSSVDECVVCLAAIPGTG
jgi:hypothetical protein